MNWEPEEGVQRGRCTFCGESVPVAVDAANPHNCKVTASVERQMRAMGFTREIES